MLTQIKKRNGDVVPFDKTKVTDAARKAFIGVGVPITESKLLEITDSVLVLLQDKFGNEKVPSVENVQDLVERAIMGAGYFDVAKAYMLYRYEHTKIREEKKQEVLQKIKESSLLVTKRSGKKELFLPEKLRKTLLYHMKPEGSSIDIDAIIKQCKAEVYDGVTTEEVRRALIMTVRSMIERDPAYSKLAARLLLDRIYKTVFGADMDYERLQSAHAQVFERNIRAAVKSELLDERMLDFDFQAIGKRFNLENDYLFEYMGLEILSSRYFMEEPGTNRTLETPQMFWMRIAMGTTLLEKKEDKERVVADFYDVLSNFYYTPGGRTLFQAGAKKAQLSNCFLNVVPDSLDGIFKAISDNAQYLKWSGGTGTSWTSLRSTGAAIKGTGVNSQGVIPFLKIANDVNVAINRSGKRRGAGCIYLETWHLDIEDFMELRKNTGDERRRTHDINTANWIPDLFMKRVRDNGEWTLFSPEEVPDLHEIYGAKFEKQYEEYEKMADEGKIKLWKRVPAIDIWKKMLAMLFETGHPWVTFKDPCNIRSPQDHAGVVHSSNLCTEITLNTEPNETAVCNLGSLNFAKFIVNGKFDKELVGKVTRSAIRMLDNVIDINYYPTEDARRGNMRHRPVGLGVRGYHDALYMQGIDFDSQEAVEFADQSMEVVAYYAILASSELAKERGTYSTYKGSKWDRNLFPQDTVDLLEKERGEEIEVVRGGRLDWTPVREHVRTYGMRNSNTMAIAPTASTANLVGCIPCVEPIYKNIYVKSNKEGEFPVLNKYLVEALKDAGLWNKGMLNKIKYYDGSVQDISEIPPELKRRFKEVFEIDQRWLIEAAARRAKWIDQSQSLNIFFRGTSGRDLSEVYFHAWRLGLKTTYYLRTLGASQVEKSTVSTAEFGSTHTRNQYSAKDSIRETVQQVIQETTPVPSGIPGDVVPRMSHEEAEHLARVMNGEEVGICESCQG
ncbi:ribonucleoside-diphosphate reductase subunit alpha [bacterium]|nr:ribonucleoside-diphosphate reductase subunit alpha [bacterium]